MGAKLTAYKPLSIQYFSCYQVWIDSSERTCDTNCKSNRHQCDGGEETSAILSLSFTSVSGNLTNEAVLLAGRMQLATYISTLMLETLLNCDSCCHCTATNMPDPPTIIWGKGFRPGIQHLHSTKNWVQSHKAVSKQMSVFSLSLSLCILCDLRKVTLTLEGFRFCHYLCWVYVQFISWMLCDECPQPIITR